MQKPLTKVIELKNPIADSMYAKITLDQWDIITGRQETFSPHRETQSIFIKSVPDPVGKNDRDMMFVNGSLVYHDVYTLYKDELDSILEELKDVYDYTEWAACLVNLPAGKEVYKHMDHYPHPENLKRIHIPIITNDQVFWYCGSIRANMKKDIGYEVRNLEHQHSVINKGTTDRIHLILDIDGVLKQDSE
jgi:hypothetical protein